MPLCFINGFESQPLLLNVVRLRGSQFSQNVSQHFMAPCHYYYRRFTVVIHLSPFVEDSENTNPCHLYEVKNCFNIFLAIHRQLSGWGYTCTLLTFWSQLMYTVKLLNKWKAVLPWYSHFQKHGFFCGFAVQITVAFSIALFRSPSFGLWHREVIASSASKTASVAAEQRALLVFSARNSIWNLFAGWFANASSIVYARGALTLSINRLFLFTHFEI